MVRQGLRQKVSSGYVKSSIMLSYLAHFSVQVRKIKYSARKFLIFRWKWNFLTLILNLFDIFSKESCSYISGTEAPKKFILLSQEKAFLIFQETENPKKKFLIFQETELFFYSKPWYNGTFLIIRERNIHNSGITEFSCLSGNGAF